MANQFSTLAKVRKVGLDLIQCSARMGATRRGAARGYKSRNVPRFDTRRVE